ncbi:PREDICTED: uncharacterized protein LOC104703798 [Camelina sativa]|uniref:Uncharacterized protein LOC104703798 n=1 Tax=Camelina sativa TaxID=90675 RepID=A0ABM0SYZ7_CAMSA|nr:PREDICTED: uncharacterized protein LOC104703798 [Camelina sativa]
MYSLILHGRRSIELQKWTDSVKLLQNAFAFFSSARAAADVSLRDGRKGKNFTVSYLVGSLGLTTKLAESISRRVSFEVNGNADSVLSLFRSHGFTDPQISSIIMNYPRLLMVDAEKSLGPKLQFLLSRGASSSELTEIVSEVPKILGKKGVKTLGRYYDFVKVVIEADKSSNLKKICHSLPQGSKQENKIRNVLLLRDLGVPKRLLFPLLISDAQAVCGKEKFEESLKKVVEMGFDPTTAKFVQALRIVQGLSDKTMQEKVNVYTRLGFDGWEMFNRYPIFLALSEKNILNSAETFLSLGFSRDEFAKMVKHFPPCIGLSAEMVKKKVGFLVMKMNWPRTDLVSHPAVLGYDMERRIVPRCNVIKTLMSKGLLGETGKELPPIGCVLKNTDKEFLNRFVRKFDDQELVAELMTIFTGDLQKG